MKLLIIGGTKFVGRTIVDTALTNGHEITMFNRGTTNPELFPQVEKLHGDRDSDLAPLKGRTWDAVIDTCGFVPRVVEKSAELLKDQAGHYTFISTISVYSNDVYSKPGTDENGPLAHLEDDTTEEITGETYGGLKVLCEEAVDAAFLGRALIVRPGLIVGPHDPTDRFTYWPVSVARGGTVLAPPEDAPLQIIDVRDLSEWIVRMVEQSKTGEYNATGPDYSLTFGKALEACKDAAEQTSVTVLHTDEEFLLEHEIQPWMDLPLWLPASHNGMSQVNVNKAIGEGLTFRALSDTVRATLAWYRSTRGLDDALKAGISAERESELLAAWAEKA